MGKTLLLAEKLSQAMDLARGLGEKFERKDGYLEAPSYIITWAAGHLVELCEPHEYDPGLQKWSLGSLPIAPEDFKYRVIPSAKKQFAVVRKMTNRKDVEKLVICTDPAREGELIARLILTHSGWWKREKPTYRFWTSKALTPEAVKEAMKELRPSRDFNRLYDSALARQRADWLVGINATRAFTLAFGNGGVFSVGRVQTPVLRLLVEREKEIENFRPRDYWTVKAFFRVEEGSYVGLWIGEDGEGEEGSRIFEKAKAEALVRTVSGKEGTVLSVKKKRGKEQPPQLFSLTTLQQEANKKLGLTAQQTLDLAQRLYEKKFLSYPRTESKVLAEDQVEEVKRILSALSGVFPEVRGCLNPSKAGKRVFNNAGLTDHHALVPTGKIDALDQLSAQEEKLYELVVRRFIAAFHPPVEYETTTVITGVEGERFISKGRVILNPGWRKVYGNPSDTELPPLKRGQNPRVEKTEAEKKQTKPPSRFTDSALLKAMTEAWRFTEDKRWQKILRSCSGIGTPATRAGIIETLLQRGYVERRGRNLVPTEKGRFLIEKLGGEQIADVAYTALWEAELDAIARGESRLGLHGFTRKAVDYASRLVDVAKKLAGEGGFASEKRKAEPFAKCPLCGSAVVERPKSYSCTGEGCSFVLWKKSSTRLFPGPRPESSFKGGGSF